MKKLSITLNVKSVRALFILAFAGAASLPIFANPASQSTQSLLTQSVSRGGVVKTRSLDARGVMTNSMCLTNVVDGVSEQQCVSETVRLSPSQAEAARVEILSSAHAVNAAVYQSSNSSATLRGNPDLTVEQFKQMTSSSQSDMQSSSKGASQRLTSVSATVGSRGGASMAVGHNLSDSMSRSADVLRGN